MLRCPPISTEQIKYFYIGRSEKTVPQSRDWLKWAGGGEGDFAYCAGGRKLWKGSGSQLPK